MRMENRMAKNARELCLDALCRVYRDGSYSSLTLDRLLRRSALTGQEAALATALFYGVVERDLALCRGIARYSSRRPEKLDLEITVILKMGLYQLLYLEQIPPRAAVNETVALCRYARKASAAGFVNAVLRAFLRGGRELLSPDDPPLTRLSVRYSCPEWLIRLWSRDYSPEIAEKLLEASVGRPPLSIRVNPLKTTDEALVGRLAAHGIAAEPDPLAEHCLRVTQSGSLADLPEYREGLFHVQDLSSQLCARILGAEPGMTVFDLCAAPGGKTFTIAQQMDNRGAVYAFDLHPNRVKLIREGAERLGTGIVRAETGDAARFREDLPQADRVLCDVPCAGLGVIRRKPEIKYKPEESLRGLPEIQGRILENGSRYVRPGGRLLYSTCSLSRAENEEVAERFLSRHPEFAPVNLQEWEPHALVEGNMVTFFPHLTGGDGFFAALFERRAEPGRELV